MCCSPWGCKESDTTEQRRRVLAAGHLQLLLSLLNPVGHRPTPSRQDSWAGPRPCSPGTSPSEAPCFWNLHTCFPWSAGGCFFPLQLPEASLTPSEGHPQSNPEMPESMASNLWGAGKQDSPDFCVRRTNSRALWDGGPQLECQDLVTCGRSEAVFSCGFQILETTCYLGGTSFSHGLRGQGHERCGWLSASQKQRVEEHSPPTPPLSGPRRVWKT